LFETNKFHHGVPLPAGGRGKLLPLPPLNPDMGGGSFFITVYGNFMVWQDRIETNLSQLFAQQKIQNGFQSFLLFLRSILLLNRQKYW